MIYVRTVVLTLLIGLDGLFIVLQAVKIWEDRRRNVHEA